MSYTIPITSDGKAAEHGPWCDDTRRFPPPPKCQTCEDET